MVRERRRFELIFMMKPYMSKYGLRFAVAVVCLTFEALCDLMLPTFMARMIDHGIAKGDMHLVLQIGAWMLGIALFGAVSASGRNILSTHVSQSFGAELRADLFRRIQGLSFTEVDRFERASLVTRLTNDVTQVQNFVNGMMRIFMRAPMLCLGSLIMAVRLDARMSLVLFGVLAIAAALIAVNMRMGFPSFLRMQRALDRVNGMMREYLSGVRVVKAFNRFDYEVERFEGGNEELRDRSTAALRLMALFSPGVSLTVNVGLVSVVALGGYWVNAGSLQVGHVVAFINYVTQMLFALLIMTNVFNMFIRARASAERVAEVFVDGDRDGKGDGGWVKHINHGRLEPVEEEEQRGCISFEHVTFSYEGANGQRGEPVLRDVSFTCQPGETVGIIGSTGAGKSSLVNLIPRFYEVTSGRIRVNGIDVSGWNPYQLRERIAVVPQKAVLFTGTVRENLLWGRQDAAEEDMMRAAEIAEAHGFIMASPEWYETRIGQGGVNFSGGQKQRLSLARALLRDPDILILDDATSALDVATEARIKASFQRMGRRMTRILIAQRMSSVMDADRILVMDQGEIVGLGTHAELLRTCRVYQEIYESQMWKEEASSHGTN